MAVESGFDLRELEALNHQFLDLAQTQYPKEAKKFLRTEANKARKKLRANTKAATKRKPAISSKVLTVVPFINLMAIFKYGSITTRPIPCSSSMAMCYGSTERKQRDLFLGNMLPQKQPMR